MVIREKRIIDKQRLLPSAGALASIRSWLAVAIVVVAKSGLRLRVTAIVIIARHWLEQGVGVDTLRLGARVVITVAGLGWPPSSSSSGAGGSSSSSSKVENWMVAVAIVVGRR